MVNLDFGTMKICSRQGLFKLMSVNHSSRFGSIIGILSIFFSMKLYCVFLLESQPGGNSNGYTQGTIFNKKKENHPEFASV